MGITILPPRRFCFLILFSFCLLTVQLHFTPIVNFKQSTHAQKKKICLHSFPIHYIYTFYYYCYFLFSKTNDTHTCTHKELSWDVINFSLLWSSALLSGLALIFLFLSFSVQFLFREVLLPHCRFKGYNAIKYLNKNTWIHPELVRQWNSCVGWCACKKPFHNVARRSPLIFSIFPHQISCTRVQSISETTSQ